jgi:hypothetical protein
MRYRLASLLLLLLISLSVAIRAQSALQVQITNPKEGSRVAHREQVSGTVSDSAESVWLVIHPLDTSEFWIQPPITVRDDGTWKVIPYFGRSPSRDVGARFEVRAFAKPTIALKEGKVAAWPEAAARSIVIEVSRK